MATFSAIYVCHFVVLSMAQLTTFGPNSFRLLYLVTRPEYHYYITTDLKKSLYNIITM